MTAKPRSAVLAVLAVMLLAAACGEGQPAADRAPERYVALGDSYTAAPGAGLPIGEPAVCGRSENNYPRLVAAELRPAEFVDASCGGATTRNVTEAQRTNEGTNPPQLDAITPDTTLVTIGLGANDVGLFLWAQDCAAKRRTGTPCRDRLTAGGRDRLAEAVTTTASKIGTMLWRIERKAPRATIVVVGYPTVFPEDATKCWPEPAFGDGDVRYLRQRMLDINAMLAEQARGHGVVFADTAAATAGHSMCAPPEKRWVEGFRSTTGAAALHPTAEGQRAMADTVLQALRNGSGNDA